MTPSIPSIRSHVFLVALTLGLSACASMEERDAAVTGIEPERLEQVRAAAAAPPRLQAGDRFSYDNPDVTWEVVSVGADGRIAWRSNTGETQVTDANPLLPALEWASPERGSGKRLITNMSRPMFPLTPGEKLTFRETVDTNVPPFAWEYDWQCVSGPLERTDVPMGGFPTYRIQCGRKGTDEVVFHYAPEIGNYVKLVVQDAAGGMPQIRSLTDYVSTAGAMRMEATGAPKPGEVMLEAEQPDEMSKSINGAQGNQGEAGQVPSGPRPLGMIAGVQQGSQSPTQSQQPAQAPAQPPQSGLASDSASEGIAGNGATVQPGTISVHLASYKNAENAETGWKALMAGNRDQLEGLRPIIRRVDLGTKGIFFRLHAGPVIDKVQADAICRTLSQRGVYCKAMTL